MMKCFAVLWVDTFINLTEDEPGEGSFLEMYDPFLPDHCIVDRYPIVDVNIPTEEFMVTILDAIPVSFESKVSIFTRERTVAVAGSYVHGHATPDTVGDLISELRVGDRSRL